MSHLSRVRARAQIEGESIAAVLTWLDTPQYAVDPGTQQRVAVGTPLELTSRLIGAGYPSGGDGGGGGIGRPTETAATKVDPAEKALRDTLADIEQMGRLANGILHRISQFVPRKPNEKDKHEAKTGETPTCQSCRRVNVVSPPKLEKPSDVGGRLAEPKWLCSDCYRWVTDWGELPPRKVVTARAEGRIIRTRVEGQTVTVLADGAAVAQVQIPKGTLDRLKVGEA